MAANGQQRQGGEGILPIKSDEHRLERESLTKFEALLGFDEFEVRFERISDAGVDLSIELTPGNQFSNYRAQVQMKASK